MAQQPLVGQGFLIIAASRSHSNTPHPAGLFWTSDQPDTITQNRQIPYFRRDLNPQYQQSNFLRESAATVIG
jgi:hypothetical protein